MATTSNVPKNLTPEEVKKQLADIQNVALNIKEGLSTLPATTPTTAPATAPSTAPITTPDLSQYGNVPDTDISASFLAGLKNLQTQYATTLEKQAETFPTTEEITKQGELSKERIKTTYDITREEIAETQKWAQQALEWTKRDIFLQPAIARKTVDAYTQKVEQLTSQVSKALERLNLEEEQALLNQDYLTLQTIRQNKQDFLSLQQQAISNSLSFLNTFYQTMMGERQYKQSLAEVEKENATNQLNFLLDTYKGQKIENVPIDVQTKLIDYATKIGIPYSAVEDIINAPITGKTSIHHAGDNFYVFDESGNLLKTIYAPSSTTPNTQELTSTLDNFINGRMTFTSIPADQRDDIGIAISNITNHPVAGLIYNKRLEIEAQITSEKFTAADYDTLRQNMIDDTVKTIMIDKNYANQIISQETGMPASYVNPKDAVREIVEKYVDTYLSREYFNNASIRSKSFYFSGF